MLVKCPECELQVSDKAFACPHCGFPMKGPKYPRKPSKRRRLPNGFGQISEIKGRNLRKPFRAMITIGKTETGRPICKPLKPESYFETYNDAYTALIEYNKNPYDLDPCITMRELHDKWTEKFYPSLSHRSQATGYDNCWLYCGLVYDMKVSDIRVRHIKACMEEGTANIRGVTKHANARCQGQIKSMFNLMLDFALEYEIVEYNYARSFKLPKKISEQSQNRDNHIPFSDSELDLLWSNLGKVENIDLVLIQCYSGWRPQEMGELRTDDVNLEDWTFKGGLKTKAGKGRTIPIHSRIQPLIKARYKEAIENQSEYLFTYKRSRKTDTHLGYRRFNYLFYDVIKALDLNPEHKPHDGRKTFVTLGKKYHVNDFAIKRIVGHAIYDITEKVYTERDPDWLRTEIEKIV